MTGPVLIDSDILIEVLRQRNHEISDRWVALAGSAKPVAYSPISSAEIWRGARASEAAAIATLFSALICIPIDAVIGKRAGEYLARYRASHGMGIGKVLRCRSQRGRFACRDDGTNSGKLGLCPWCRA